MGDGGIEEGVVGDDVCMWSIGEGWLFDGRQRDGFVAMVCVGEGQLGGTASL